MVLPYVNMNPPWVYTCSPSWTLSHIPPHTIPLGHPSAPAPSILYQTWTGDPFHIWYYTCFHAIPPNHPTLSLSHRVQKTVLCICVSFAVLHIGHCYHLSKFHIYALVYVLVFGKIVMITLYERQQKRHRCIEQSFGLCGRGRGCDDLGEWHGNMYNII